MFTRAIRRSMALRARHVRGHVVASRVLRKNPECLDSWTSHQDHNGWRCGPGRAHVATSTLQEVSHHEGKHPELNPPSNTATLVKGADTQVRQGAGGRTGNLYRTATYLHEPAAGPLWTERR